MKAIIALLVAGFSTVAFACDKELVNMKTPGGYPSETTVTFNNQSPEKMTVSWVDFDGELITYAELNPGESYEQPTYVSHVWVVSDESSNCFGPFIAGEKQSREVVIQ